MAYNYNFNAPTASKEMLNVFKDGGALDKITNSGLDREEKALELIGKMAAIEEHKLDRQNKETQNKWLQEAHEKTKKNENANADFTRAILTGSGKTWLPMGDVLTEKASATITNAMAYKDTDTPEERIAKEKMQLGFSDWYDKQGQKLYESEKMAEYIKGSDIITPEMTAAYVNSKKAEEDIKGKKSETALKSAEAYTNQYTDAVKAKLDNEAKIYSSDARVTAAEMRGNKAEMHGNKAKNDGMDTHEVYKLINSVKDDITYGGGESAASRFIRDTHAKGISEKDIARAISAATDEGKLFTTFDSEKAENALRDIRLEKKSASEQPGSAFNKTTLNKPDLTPLDDLISKNKALAAQNIQKASDYLLDTDEQRRRKAQTSLDAYLKTLNVRPNQSKDTDVAVSKKNIVAPSAPTAAQKDDVTSLSNVNNIDKNAPKSIAGGVNPDGTLTKEALSAINSTLGSRRLPEAITPEEANKRVTSLLKDREIHNRKDSKSEQRGRPIYNATNREIVGYEKTQKELDDELIKENKRLYDKILKSEPNMTKERALERLKLVQ